MNRKAAFLDTSVVSWLARRSSHERHRIWDYVRTRWQHVISAMTVTELLVAMHRGDDIHWGDRRERFDILVELDANAEILTIPHEYLCGILFGTEPTTGYAELDLRNWLQVTRSAVSRYALRDVTVDGQRRTFLLGQIDHDMAVVREKFLQSMKRWQNWKRNDIDLTFRVDGQPWSDETPADKEPSHEVWAGAVVSQAVEATEENAKRAASVTSAAYTYYRAIWRLTKSNWKFENDTGAWADAEQLLYLCDPRIHMIYIDNDFKTRTVGSSQISQLIHLNDVAKGAGLKL